MKLSEEVRKKHRRLLKELRAISKELEEMEGREMSKETTPRHPYQGRGESDEASAPQGGSGVKKKRSYATEVAEQYIKEHPETFKKLADR